MKHFIGTSDGQWKVGPKFPGLHRGAVHVGVNVHTMFGVAVKVEPKFARNGTLTHEMRIYRILWRRTNGAGLAPYYVGGSVGRHRYMVLERLGENLQVKLHRCGGRLSLKTVLMVGIQAIRRMRGLHEDGFVHRQVEPRNFVMGRFLTDETTVYTVDLKFAAHHAHGTAKHALVPDVQGLAMRMWSRFTSTRHDNGLRVGRADDLESVGFTLVYLLSGCLPWEDGVVVGKRNRFVECRASQKLKMSSREVCKGVPQEFERYMRYVRGLDVDEQPDYDLLESIFENSLFDRGYADDGQFDWSGLSTVPLVKRPEFVAGEECGGAARRKRGK